MGADSAGIAQIFSTARGQLTTCDNVSMVCGGDPAIADDGRVVFQANEPADGKNVFEIDAQLNVRRLTAFSFPLGAEQPTLAADTGELVYILHDRSNGAVSLVSERDGLIFSGGNSQGPGIGTHPDLSPTGLLVFQGQDPLVSFPVLAIRNGIPPAAECGLAGANCEEQCEQDLAECRAALADTVADLTGCRANPLLQDDDSDMHPDPLDRCPGTVAGASVDDSGCSLAQFCAGFDVTAPNGGKVCRNADWQNDEPLMKDKEADCRVDKGDDRRRRVDDRCVPTHEPPPSTTTTTTTRPTTTISTTTTSTVATTSSLATTTSTTTATDTTTTMTGEITSSTTTTTSVTTTSTGSGSCAEGAPCDDGKICTEHDVCHGGVCGGTPVVCPDAFPLCARCNETDSALPLGCTVVTFRCDTNPCLRSEQVGCECVTDPVVCPHDGDPCTVEFCDAGPCNTGPKGDGVPCGPGLFCRTFDDSGVSPCSAGSLCLQVGGCTEDGCTTVTPLPDGRPCGEGKQCQEGECR